MIGRVRLYAGLAVAALLVATTLTARHYMLKAHELDAELTEALRQVQARDNAIRSYGVQRAADEAAAQARQSELEQEIADYEQTLASAGRECRLDSGDLDWLRD